MSTPTSNVASVAGVSQLPVTGTGGGAAPGASILFLTIMGLVAAAAGAVLALAGRVRETEDDGIVVM
jgi:hypothetical protein